MKWEAPIVKETRRIREYLVKEAGGFDAYVKRLQERETKHKRRILKTPPFSKGRPGRIKEDYKTLL